MEEVDIQPAIPFVSMASICIFHFTYISGATTVALYMKVIQNQLVFGTLRENEVTPWWTSTYVFDMSKTCSLYWNKTQRILPYLMNWSIPFLNWYL